MSSTLVSGTDYWYGSCDDCGWRDVVYQEVRERSSLHCPDCGSANVRTSDEPLGAGADPSDRPDPRDDPEAWSE